MPFEHLWLIEDRVLFIRMWGDVTLEEFHEGANQTLTTLENADGVIHEIIDQTGVDSVPTEVLEINRFTSNRTLNK